jgi:FMN reductase
VAEPIEPTTSPLVTVRFWAGAQRAAGHAEERLQATTVGELRALLAARPAMRPVCAVASFLVDGRQAGDETALHAGAEVDVLPPFAGGSAPLVVGIGGSTRAGSLTNLLLKACLAEVEELGGRTESVTGATLSQLPIYSDDIDPAAPSELLDAVRRADCVVIATPGYHGGMSGLVKNSLDHLEALRDEDRPYLAGRAVGVIVTAAGWQACGTALVSVRSAIHALRGWPTPFGVTINSAEQHPGDEKVGGALRLLAGQLMEFASWQAASRLSAGR